MYKAASLPALVDPDLGQAARLFIAPCLDPRVGTREGPQDLEGHPGRLVDSTTAFSRESGGLLQ